ncbi:MAG: PQQ-binding-like beta-propeller repeat protein [Acidobacteria bacterium]|nr:PQQ-binding-like beta-propeller repeat protein [Acidobacteriota bacterium]
MKIANTDRQAAGGRLAALCAALVHWFAFVSPAVGQAVPEGAASGPTKGQWIERAADKAATQYSPLDQIDASNLDQLEIAWQWISVDRVVREQQSQVSGRAHRIFHYEATPLYVDGRLFISTSLGQVAEVDAATGETVWSFDPEAWKVNYVTNLGFLSRGLTYWTDGEQERLFHAAGDARLLSVDPRTRESDPNFGDGGLVDLTENLGRPIDRRAYTVTSPPTICRDVLIVGSTVFDAPRQKRMPPGHVRGYDTLSGELRWTFHTIPQEGEFGYDTWELDSAKTGGATNVWPPMSADEELGLAYLPVGTPTHNWYGGHRPGDNLFSESVVAVDCETGERVWHYQMVRHTLWDYDPPAAPNLIDIEVDGRAIPAIAIVTKQGLLFVFDRRNGKPVWLIDEREVPPSTVPGEVAAPFQPFPTRPPPFEFTGMHEENLLDLTPELRARALEIFRSADSGPLYTPPSERGAFVNPGWAGGGNWNGAAFDPETHVLYVPSYTEYNVVSLVKPDAARSNFRYIWGGESHPMIDDEIPILKPPWGRITAYDMDRGEILWQVANGDGARHHPLLTNLDLPPLGYRGSGFVLLTRTLLFATSNRDDWNPPMIRAFDKATSDQLWATELPARSRAAPMTYLHEGRQYIVVATGGGRHGLRKDQEPDALVAFALPERSTSRSGAGSDG